MVVNIKLYNLALYVKPVSYECIKLQINIEMVWFAEIIPRALRRHVLIIDSVILSFLSS